MNKKENQEQKNPTSHKKIECWKSSRALVSRTIPIELDLENREILLSDESLSVYKVQIGSKNLDNFISQHIDPIESQQVMDSLREAGKGVEKPIRFCFVQPGISKKICFEYRYQITYVSYAKTRLKGELVSLRAGNKGTYGGN